MLRKRKKEFQKHLQSGYLYDTVSLISSFSWFVLNVRLKLSNIALKRKQIYHKLWAPRLVVEYFLLVRFQKVKTCATVLFVRNNIPWKDSWCYCCFVELIWIGQYLCSDKSIWLACAPLWTLNNWIFQCEIKKKKSGISKTVYADSIFVLFELAISYWFLYWIHHLPNLVELLWLIMVINFEE